MTTTTNIAPVEKTVTVAATPDRAFDLFTTGMNSWWPGHRHSVSAGQGATPQKMVFEAEDGGAIYEILPDGSRADWGVVTVWEPGRRFAMTWHPGESGAVTTKVEVRFAAVDEGCRVTLVHSGWDALGEAGAARRGGYDGGWIKVLDDFRTALAA